MKLGKTVEIRDGKKITRKRSPIPFLVAGLVVLIMGWRIPVYRLWDYLKLIIVAFVAYAVCRGIWRDTKTEEELPPDTGDAQCDQLIQEARSALTVIRTANDRIADEKLSTCIDGIENTCRTLLNRLEEKPSLFSQLRTFMRYYLPTTVKLLEARAALENADADQENAQAVRARTERVLPEIQNAFEKQLEALDKHRYLDLQVEMDVLEGMLKSDGFDTSL